MSGRGYVASDDYWRHIWHPPSRPRGPVMCGIRWCVSYADDRTGEAVSNRSWTKQEDGTFRMGVAWTEKPPRCVVHRQFPGFAPRRCSFGPRVPRKEWRWRAAS